MNTYTSKLQQLIFGDRNIFIFDYDSKILDLDKDNLKKILKFLIKLKKLGYEISNEQALLSFSNIEFDKFKSQLTTLMEANSKEGVIFRKTFAESEELTNYTAEEWMAMYAQYAVTYHWQRKYSQAFGVSPLKVLEDYTGSLDFSDTSTIDNTKIKTFSIGSNYTLKEIIKDILESKSVLRNQQLKVLEECPKDILLDVTRDSKIIIKETLIKVMKLLSGMNVDFPLLKTANDVLRFVVASCADNPIEGKFDNSDLRKTKIHIPTSIRKALLNNLELIAKKKAIGSTEGLPDELSIMDAINLKGSRFLTEDMFLHAKFWKIIDKYLRYNTAKKTRKNYPYYTKAIDLLYEDDRSWTFNGRYSKAKENLDYEEAIMVAKERPGFLLRNLIEFLRMTRGMKIPVKVNQKKDFVFADKAINTKEIKYVKTSGIEFILSDNFKTLLQNNANTKLCWQLIEQLKNKKLFEYQYERVVQGIKVEYSTPIPAIDKKLAKKVRKILISVIQSRKREHIEEFEKVYIGDDSKGQTLQYSGKNSTEISYAGEYLTPGTELDLNTLLNGKCISNPILRIGIAWRGNESVDLDHSLTSDKNTVVYFGHPVLNVSNPIIGNSITIATSSGDITSNSQTNFSIELVDVDLIKAKELGFESFFNSVIVYSGTSSIGDLECYAFFSVIDRSERTMNRQKVGVELSKQDYSIRIDPDNTEKSKSYLCCNIDLNKGTIKALNVPVNRTANIHSSTAVGNGNIFRQALAEADINGLTIEYAFRKMFGKKCITDNIEDADLIISRTEPKIAEAKFGATVLHPGRDLETINTLLF